MDEFKKTVITTIYHLILCCSWNWFTCWTWPWPVFCSVWYLPRHDHMIAIGINKHHDDGRGPQTKESEWLVCLRIWSQSPITALSVRYSIQGIGDWQPVFFSHQSSGQDESSHFSNFQFSLGSCYVLDAKGSIMRPEARQNSLDWIRWYRMLYDDRGMNNSMTSAVALSPLSPCFPVPLFP